MKSLKSATGKYRESVAWQKGMQLVHCVYEATRSFPADERFGLTSQLRRAAVSVPSNVAEGKGRASQGELLQFLGNARGSLLEVQTQLEVAAMEGFGNEEELDTAYCLAEEVLKIINAAIATMRANKAGAR